jgi:hypothetical protein
MLPRSAMGITLLIDAHAQPNALLSVRRQKKVYFSIAAREPS